MKFVRILRRGFLDTTSVLILVVRGGVQLSFVCLWVLSVGAMWLRVSHRVKGVRVAWWSGDQCGGGGWAMVGLS
jgi:energy-converting hydrogenase Eha subunit G